MVWSKFKLFIHGLKFRASTLVDAKFSKIQKFLHFTNFDQKNIHISGCKIVHKCTKLCIYYFNNFFSLLVSRFQSLSLSSFDQIMPPLLPIIKPLPLINHQTTSIADHPLPLIIKPCRSRNHADQIIK